MMNVLARVWLIGCVACGDPSGGDGATGVSLLAREAPEATIAYRDGVGPWQRLTADAAGRYSAAKPASKYEFIVLCTIDTRARVAVYQATIDEVASITHLSECRSDVVPITGTAAGLTQMGAVIGTGAEHFVGTGNGPFTLEAPPGVRDVVGIRAIAISSPAHDAALILRDVDVATGTVIQADFANAVALEQHTATGLPYGNQTTSGATSRFVTRNGSMAGQPTSQTFVRADGVPLAFHTVPASSMLPGDLNIVTFQNSSGAITNPLVRTQVIASAVVTDTTPELLTVTTLRARV